MVQAGVLAGLALLVAALVTAGRLTARRRVARLRQLSPGSVWRALGSAPDGRPAVVAFSSAGCAACRSAQRPALAALQERFRGGVRVIHVDIAERPEVARALGVLTVPTTVLLDSSGAVRGANHGFATSERLASQLGLS